MGLPRMPGSAQFVCDDLAEEGEVAVGLRMRAVVIDDLVGDDLVGGQVDDGHERDQTGIPRQRLTVGRADPLRQASPEV